MIRLTIIGSGNVGQHLIKAFAKSEAIEIVQVFSRKKETLSAIIEYEKIVSDFSELKEADLYIIAVSDNAISEVSGQIPFQNQLVVHTSGAASIDTLDEKTEKVFFIRFKLSQKTKM